ncbi:MAG: DUF1156 domain-containing protein [Haloferacaceae archaeon]
MPDQEPPGPSPDRPRLPIERGFPIERVNAVAEKESRAKQHYRPIYTMHKWWARRPGCLFRAILLYALLDGETTAADVDVYEPGRDRSEDPDGPTAADLVERIDAVSADDPEPLWEFFPMDVRIHGKSVLDPFAGGGTSLVEASRFGVESRGVDLNPVAWFVTKKELEAGRTDVDDLEAAFERVKADVADEVRRYYRTPCPNAEASEAHRAGAESTVADDHRADVMYCFWVKELDCISCGHTVSLFPDYRVAAGRYEHDGEYNVFCPACESVVLVDDWQSRGECAECGNRWTPAHGPVTRGGHYTCPKCGQQSAIADVAAEGDGYDRRLYGLEYYCPTCDEAGRPRGDVKGYKSAGPADRALFRRAAREWERADELTEYVPDHPIPSGWKTSASEFDGSAPGAGDIAPHGLTEWTDMYNERQLLCLARLLRAITTVDDRNAREYLLLAFTEALNFNSMMVPYQAARNHTNHLFKSNSFDPPQKSSEGNPWGTEYGIGRFRSTFDMVTRAVEYAGAPTERYVDGGETVETPPFDRPIGADADVCQGDARDVDSDCAYDAVVTDPPYYDNVLYEELSDYYYVWQRIALADEYECFEPEATPRAESVVANPAQGKTAADFEADLREAFDAIRDALKADGVLAFTYHHSDAASWGELLTALCGAGFEVTATYPINSDARKFIEGEAAAFDVVIVARPATRHRPVPWNSLRRRIARTARETRAELEEHRDLTRGDVGVIEMGACFHAYSEHHGEVRRAGRPMSAKAVVDEIYGIVRGGDRGAQDVYLDLLEEGEPTYDDWTEHLERSDASGERMRERRLVRVDGDDLVLCGWDDEERRAHVRNEVDGPGDPADLDRAHCLRARYERGGAVADYRERWADDGFRALCEGLADATGDDAYLRMLGVDEVPDFGER